MKKITILVFIVSIIFLVLSCTNLDEYITLEKYNSEISELENQLEEASNIIDNNAVEITGLKEEVNNLKNDLELKGVELEKYRSLANNFNELLSSVYYGWAINNIGGVEDGFTAFSMEYKGKFYIATAGHCVENEYGKFSNFKFKANFSDIWVYPKLLTYENDFTYGKDYAIFYSEKIDKGFKTGEYELPAFILGNGKLNIIKENTKKTIEGESGSPVININSEVIGIMTGSVTNITYVLQAIDNLK